MNALFLSPNVPHPPLNGGHHRTLALLRSLARFASVHVLAVGDPGEARAAEASAAFAAWGATLEVFRPTGPGAPERDDGIDRPPDAFAHFRSPELADALARRMARAVDVVHVEEVVMSQYLDALSAPRVIDRQKVDWAYHEAMADVAPADALVHLREAARFRWWERRLAGAFDRILVPGAGDETLLAPWHGREILCRVPIGIGDDFRPPAGRRGLDYVLLYGALDYGPNVEAQQWFFREVWPALAAALPRLHVAIVGSGRPPLRAEPPPADPRVGVRGFVPDIRAVLQGPGVLVVPVRVGGGARTKVIEALACGMPVVSTALGVENLDLEPGRDFLRAETAAEAVQAIVRLAGDADLRAALGREGAARVERFRWSRIETALEPLYREAAAGAGAALRARSAERARTIEWEAAPDVVRLRARIAREARGLSGWSRAWRRARLFGPAARAERAALRTLDRWWPATGSGLGGRLRRLVARLARGGARPAA